MLSVLSLKAVLVQDNLGSGVVVEQEVGTMGMVGDLGAKILRGYRRKRRSILTEL